LRKLCKIKSCSILICFGHIIRYTNNIISSHNVIRS
jgi:hypothetical protein